MRRILIITRDEVTVEIVKPERPLYGARYDFILVDVPRHETPTQKNRFWDWITGSVTCRVKDKWSQLGYFQ